MQKLVFTNGGGQSIDLTSGNFGITNWEGLSGVGLNIQTQQVPFQDGGVFLDALMEQREISVTVAIQDNNDLSARYERKRELISALNPKLGEGVLVYTNDYLSRQIKAVPQLPIFENKNSNDAGTLKASVVFSCPSPYWEDLEETVIDISDKKRKIIENNGDVPVGIKVTVKGARIGYPMIQNITTNKQIKFTSEFNDEINVNTNVGQKRAIEINNNYDYLAVGGTNAVIKYIPFFDKYYMGNTKGLFESIDGITFSLVKTFSYIRVISIVYSEELGVVCLLTYKGEIITTTDGMEFIKSFTGTLATPKLYAKFCYSKNKKIFCIHFGRDCYISYNGFEWIKTARQTHEYLITEYSEELQIFVATGDFISSSAKILTSADGINWEERSVTQGYTLGSISTIFYSYVFHKFYIISRNSARTIESSDGINWIYSDVNKLQPQGAFTMVEGNGMLLAMKSPILINKTTDGINWTQYQISELPYVETLGSCYNEGFFMVGGSAVFTSQNGQQWETILPSKTNYKKLSAINNTIYIAGQNAVSKYTQNGIQLLKQLDEQILNNILATTNLIVAIGESGLIITSTDENEWTTRTSGTANNLNGICQGANGFIIVGNSGQILKSSDGISWASQTSGTTENLKEVCYSQKLGIYVAVGSAGSILTSQNGTSWTSRTSGVTTQINDIIYSEEKEIFIAVTNADTTVPADILISEDGINWDKKSSGVTDNLIAVTYSETKSLFYVISNAESNNILTSISGQKWSVTESIEATVNDILADGDYIYICGDSGCLFANTTEVTENIISKLSPNTDMSLGLQVGENELLITTLTGDTMGTLSFRQKYIGV